MPRFVILAHDRPFLHWDFLLENGDGCRAWRLLADPDSMTNDIPAEALPDHRLMYLNFEGPIGGGRGTVTQWDTGTFEWNVNRPEVCEVILAGRRWIGSVRLEQINNQMWTCHHRLEITVLSPRPGSAGRGLG